MSTETLEKQIRLLVFNAIGLRFIQTVHKQTLFAFYGFSLQVSEIISSLLCSSLFFIRKKQMFELTSFD